VKLPTDKELWEVLVGYASFPVLKEALEEEGLWSLYQDLELPLIEVLCDMELHGVRVDMEYLEEMKTKLRKTIDEIEKEIIELSGEPFNINSPKQLSKILFETLELKPLKKTKTGYSTDAEVLEKLKDDHPIVSLVLEYRKLGKLNSTYVEGLLEQGSRKDGVIHTSYNQTVTATGRLSSTDPNLQNIPVRTEESKLIRRAFKPVEEGNILMAADYSQIELRVLAHLSGDEKITQAYLDNIDIHTSTASEVFDIPIDMVNKAMRRKAKAVNFGIVYGISDFGLARDLSIPVYEAKEYIETYFDRYPGVKAFIDNTITEAKTSGEVRTMLNRKRRIRNINSSNFNARSGAERMAMNTPVQGSAADIIKIAMLLVDEALKKEGLKAKMILQVHDEIILELPPKELDAAASLLRRCMEAAYKMSVPLTVDMKSGSTWYDMEEF
jgi:DNA polymerase-1